MQYIHYTGTCPRRSGTIPWFLQDFTATNSFSSQREGRCVYAAHTAYTGGRFSVLKREFMISISCWSLVNVITPWGGLDIAGCQGISSGLCHLGLCMLLSNAEARSDLLGATSHTGPGSYIMSLICCQLLSWTFLSHESVSFMRSAQ